MTEPTDRVLLGEIGAWVKKYERLRSLVTAELGLPDFDALAAAEARGRQQGWADAIATLRDDQRYTHWYTQMAPDHPEYGYWREGRRHLADYLTVCTPKETTDV